MVTLVSKMPSWAVVPIMRSFLVPCALLVLLLMPAHAGASALLPQDEAVLFARPLAMTRLADDPWLGGVWIGSDAGVFFKDLQSGGLRHYGYAEGMQHNKVRDLFVTADRVWIATGGGLMVLDKGTQQIRQVTSGGAPLSTVIETVHVDSRGVWFGTPDKGLFRADEQTLEAVAVPDPMTGQPFQKLVAGLGSTGPELFISVTGHGLVLWNRDTGKADLYSKVYVQPQPAFGRILVLPDEVWVSTQGDGIVRLARSNGWQTSEFSSPDTTGAMTTYRPILVGNAVYIPTMSGAARFDRGTQSWRDWLSTELGGSANDLVLHDGSVYAATNYGDVRRYDRSTDTWQLVEWWTGGHVLAQNTVRSCDRDGDLLAFGTMGGGANYLDLDARTFTKAGEFSWEHGKPANIAINAIDSAGGHRYYGLGTGFSDVDTTTGEYRLHYTDGRVGEGRGHNPVTDIFAEPDGAWIASTSVTQPRPRATSPEIWNHGGLAHLDLATGTVERFGTAAGLPDENVTTVAATADRVFVGTRSAGLQAFDRATKTFQPVAGAGTVINDLLLDQGTLWVAAAENGVIRVDPTTLLATPVPGWPGGPALSLLSDAGTLWTSTVFAGLHAYKDGTWTSYHTGRAVDSLAFCMLSARGTLFLGTGWGIERFDLASRQFLPQLAGLDLAGQAAASAPSAATVAIEAVPAATASPIVVHGSAALPAGSHVEVAWDGEAWTDLGPQSAWSASFPVPSGTTGSAVVTARVVAASGASLAQAARTVSWRLNDTQAAPTTVRHTPVLDASVGAPLQFILQADDPAGLTATLDLKRPGGATESIPFEAVDGLLVAKAAAFEEAGDASYRIVVESGSGQTTFPEPFSSFGPRYGIVVRGYDGQQAAAILARGPIAALPGGTANGTFYVNNVGAVPIHMALSFEGPAAAWVKDAPAMVSVPPGESYPVRFLLEPPAKAHGSHELKAILSSEGTVAATQAFEVKMVSSAAGLDGDGKEVSKGAPGLGLGPLVMLLAVVLALSRRR